MDRHTAMHCFCRVVEQGSLSAAARDLNLSNSVVTKAVQSLEDWTGCRLLARTTRNMQPTQAGERFYAFCVRMLSEVEDALTDVRAVGQGLTGRLVVAAPASLTLSTLAPHLHAFQQAHPQIELEVQLHDRAVDMVRDGIDVALRGRAALEDSTLVAVPLMELARVVCAAPAYWARHGRPATPQDLVQHNCMHYLLGEDREAWSFDGPDGVVRVPVRGNFRSDNSLLLIDAMRRGAGLGLVPALMVQEALAQGTLQTALEDFRAQPRRLFALYPSRAHLAAKVQAFVAFLRARLQSPVNPSDPSAAPP